ncbi:MAG: tetratricopeptide repeat protein [Polyangiaceae bacterium]|nr:tetratricopeptide repeat protein [Polyangiaceae bacterium]
MKLRLNTSLLLSALLLTSAGARAQTADAPAPVTVAEQLFYKGRYLIAQGRIREACEAFEQAEQAEATIGLRLNLADCYEKLGHTASAFSKFGQALSDAQQANDSREAYARQRLAALEGRLTKVTIDASSLNGVPGADVWLDERPLLPTQWGAAIPVDPGPHSVKATAAGGKTWSSPFDVVDSMTVVVPDLRIASPFWNAQRVTSLSLLIAGALSAGAGLYFAVQSKVDSDHADSLANPPVGNSGCRSPTLYEDACSHMAELRRAQGRDARFSYVFYGVGGALAASAVVAWLWPQSRANSMGWIEPQFGPGQAGMTLHGAF